MSYKNSSLVVAFYDILRPQRFCLDFLNGFPFAPLSASDFIAFGELSTAFFLLRVVKFSSTDAFHYFSPLFMMTLTLK
jgi:hypothetical protein